jgi:RNA polymerase sigma factor (sigma-70 family)
MPPPAEGFTARLVLGPALRTQPDRRLVALVRDGYELAFEEIVRRYGKPLARYAAAIVGSRSEDVTQDAFSKALLALRRDGAEIELRPWLFRIVRNTALNELRDNPPSPEVLAEAIAGGRNPAEEIERREELTDLMQRLQSLPEPQRAAIVMRELEGLGHEEIAAALGLSGGGARQAIYRARRALREGLGMLLPLPLLRLLIDQGSDVAAAGAGAGAGGAAAASGAIGGTGAGIALKAGVVTALLAGSVGTGIALHNHGQGDADASAVTVPSAAGRPITHPVSAASARGSGNDAVEERHGQDDASLRGPDRGSDGSGDGSEGDNHGRVTSEQTFAPDDGGPGPSSAVEEHHGQRGAGPGDDGRGDLHGERQGGRDDGESGDDSHSGPGGGPSGGDSNEQRHGDGRRGGDDGSGRGPGSDSGVEAHHSSGGDDSGSAELAAPPPSPEESPQDSGGGSNSDSGNSGSNSGSGSGPSEGGRRGGEELP